MSAVPQPGASPTPPSGAVDEYQKLRYAEDLEAWLEHWKQEQTVKATAVALEATRQDAARAAEETLLKSMHDAYIEVTKTSLERSITRANFVTASVGAIVTIYTGLLALVYAAKPGEGKALGPVAVIPAVFFGLSLFLITVYAATIRRSVMVGRLLPSAIGGDVMENRLITFMEFCFAGILARAWAMNSGIVSFGWGAVMLPVPFLKISNNLGWVFLGAGLLLVIAAALVTWGWARLVKWWPETRLVRWWLRKRQDRKNRRAATQSNRGSQESGV